MNREEAQFRVFKNLINEARLDEIAKNELLRGLANMAVEARRHGRPEPLAAAAAYNQVTAAFSLNRMRDLNRLKEQRFLEVFLSVEKSHVPFSDEPGIYFPPLKTWQAVTKIRKEKYEVSSLPDDEKGRKEAGDISKILAEPIDTKDFTTEMTLNDFLGMLTLRIKGKYQKDLNFLIYEGAFKEEKADAPDVGETMVKFKPYPNVMSVATALRYALSKIPTNNATYLIRRNYVEITTIDFMTREKVLRVYPVADLIVPYTVGGTANQLGAAAKAEISRPNPARQLKWVRPGK